jgi:hypothetical protein
MVDQLPDLIIQKICDFLPETEIKNLSVSENRFHNLSYPHREEYCRQFLRGIYREYFEQTGVDPEIAFGPISEQSLSSSPRS